MEEKTRKSSDARIRASYKYNLANVKYVKFGFNKKTDADIIEFLDEQPNKLKFVKELIRNEIARRKAV